MTEEKERDILEKARAYADIECAKIEKSRALGLEPYPIRPAIVRDYCYAYKAGTQDPDTIRAAERRGAESMMRFRSVGEHDDNYYAYWLQKWEEYGRERREK